MTQLKGPKFLGPVGPPAILITPPSKDYPSMMCSPLDSSLSLPGLILTHTCNLQVETWLPEGS